MHCNTVLVLFLMPWQTAAVFNAMSCEAPESDAKDMSLLQVAKAASINNVDHHLAPHSIAQEREQHASTHQISRSAEIKTTAPFARVPGTSTTAGMLSAALHKVIDLVNVSVEGAPPLEGAPLLEGAPIDFVYCWAGERTQLDDGGAQDNLTVGGDTVKQFHVDGMGYNEMELSLKALHRYAPWFNQTYLLVNGPQNLPTWAAQYPRVKMIDRCTLFPSKLDCPTNSTASCQSIAHLVPGLQEQFVYMDDDFIFVNDVVPSDFFSDDGKPRLTMPVTDSKVQRMYGPQKSLTGPNIPPVNVPFFYVAADMIKVHQPLPMTRNFSKFLELQYPEWYPFMRSHTNRFHCCDASLNTNGCDELFHNMYPAVLYKYQVGQEPRMFSHTVVCDCKWTECIPDALANNDSKVISLQNCYDAPTYRAARDSLMRRIDGATQ